MTDRQRAFISAVVYTFKNRKYFNWHRIGVKRLPDGARVYEFHGEMSQNKISIQDDRYNRVFDLTFFENPWGVEMNWIGKRQEDNLKLRSPYDSITFYGQGTDYYKFDGWYYSPDQVKIRDYSQDRRDYVYRVMW